MRMKTFLVLLCMAMGTLQLAAQQAGLSAQGLLMFHKQRSYEMRNSDRIVRSGPGAATGIRLELNYILPGYFIPVSGYNGLGVTILAPSVDSVVYAARLRQGSTLQIAGTARTSMTSIGFRCGYEFPQEISQFLLIHYGWGFAWTKYKSQRVLPAQSSTFNYTAADFNPQDLKRVVDGGGTVELLIGGVYELEKFSLMAQYSAIIPFMAYDSGVARLQHGLSAGIFYTLADLR